MQSITAFDSKRHVVVLANKLKMMYVKIIVIFQIYKYFTPSAMRPSKMCMFCMFCTFISIVSIVSFEICGVYGP